MKMKVPESNLPRATQPDIWERSLSCVGSLVVHLTLLGLLAAIVLPGFSSSGENAVKGEFLDTTVTTGPRVELLASLSGAESSPTSSSQEVAHAATNVSEAVVDTTPQAELAAPLELNRTGIPAGGMKQSVTTGTRGGGKGRGAGNGGAGTGQGGQGTGSGGGGFFGLSVKGKSTVFVVDASMSMNMFHPGPARTRFNRVKLELLRTIAGMTEEEQFFIVFFGDGAIPMPASQMVAATEDNQKRYLTWMAKVPAIGRTYPQQALLLALQLKPDLIYFLTDGEFDYAVVPGVTAANRDGIPIHTIGFGDNRGEVLMREIAVRNNGTYTFIPSDEPASQLSAEEASRPAANAILSQTGN